MEAGERLGRWIAETKTFVEVGTRKVPDFNEGLPINPNTKGRAMAIALVSEVNRKNIDLDAAKVAIAATMACFNLPGDIIVRFIERQVACATGYYLSGSNGTAPTICLCPSTRSSAGH